jgi:hypothetical protein
VDIFFSLAKDQAAVIRQKLLETLGTEPDRTVRNKISDAVAEVGRQYADNSESVKNPANSLPETDIQPLYR